MLGVGKEGIAYLLDAANLGQVGNSLASLDLGSGAYGAAARIGSRAFVPCTRTLVAVETGGDKISAAWSLDGGSCPSIVAAGAVWALGYDGTLRALDPATGNLLFSAKLSRPVSRFIAPSAAGGRLFLAEGAKLLAFALR